MSAKWLGNIDMYRKIPVDLMEGTRRGSVFSYAALGVMVLLFTMETQAFLKQGYATDLKLDDNKEPRVRVNFNITMMDLRCDYAVVDVVSVLGTEQNITAHVSKWNVDAAGVRQRYQGRNRGQQDIQLSDPSLGQAAETLYENGEDAISLDEETFEYARKEKEYLFVDFYASWCSHCKQLAPTWEALAEVMTAVADNLVEEKMAGNKHYSDEDYAAAKLVELPVLIAKVDCVSHPAFCQKQGIMAYPTLRLFVDGERWRAGDYRGDRTVVKMADYLRQIEDVHKTEKNSTSPRNLETAHESAKEVLGDPDDEEGRSAEEAEWAERVKRRKQRLHNSWVDEDHPGCQLTGHVLLDRVPGNFHIQARSAHHDLVPHMTNVSHVVHHLTVGEPVVERMIERGTFYVPDEVKGKIAPMDGNAYVTFDLHEAYHHYLKVVTTNMEGLKHGKRDLKAYQIIQSSQLSFYRSDVIPEAKFIMDLSPISVSYRKTSRHWYDYLTSVMAIIGGAFTVIGMVESTLYAAARRKRPY